MKVAVAANTLAESATTTAVPYVDVHELTRAWSCWPGERAFTAKKPVLRAQSSSGLALSWLVVDDDQGPTSRPRPGAV
jgi:hypothetical protein